VAAPLAGVLVDRWRRTTVLLAAVVLYGVAGSTGAVLESLPAILVSRALLGVAVAGVMTSVTTLIADYVDGPARARFMARQAASMGVGGVVFLTLGGALADRTWRGPFVLYLAALALIPAVRRFLVQPRPRPGSGGAADPSGGGGGRGTAMPPRAAGMRAIAAVAFGSAVVAQLAFYMIPTQLPFYLTALTGANGTRSGLAIAGSTLSAAAASLVYPRLAARLSPPATLAVSFGLLGAGYVALGAATAYAAVLGALAVAGAGAGLVIPTLSVWLAGRVPSARRGRALGGLTSALFAGQFLSPLVVQPVSAAVGLAGAYTLAGGALLVVAVVFVLARRQIGALGEPLVAHAGGLRPA